MRLFFIFYEKWRNWLDIGKMRKVTTIGPMTKDLDNIHKISDSNIVVFCIKKNSQK
jgi:hypothetical protein